MFCSCHYRRIHVHLFPVNLKKINETNYTYHRWVPFGQKHLCRKAGSKSLFHPCLSCYGTHMGRRVSQTGDTSSEWTNIEEEKELSRHALSGRTILIDCITLWCTNFFFDLKADTDQALTAAKKEFDRFTSQDATFIFVTNEIGMGGTSENEIQRKFTDMQGWMNQYIASQADEVILMVSGIPVKIKEDKRLKE